MGLGKELYYMLHKVFEEFGVENQHGASLLFRKISSLMIWYREL